MNREEAVLRELNLYPVWKQRVQAAPLSPSSSDGTTDMTTSHLTKAASCQVIGYSHSTKHDKAVQVAAYPASGRGERDSAGEGEVDVQIDKSSEQIISEINWPELKEKVRNCTACKLRAGCTQTVFGVGDEKADWLFVGEGPGADEDAQGEPFVGQAGKLLDNMLMAIKLKRGTHVYIANIVKCRPPGNRTPEADEIATCLPFLQRQIVLIQPKIIVALGKTAATALLGKEATLASLRGRLHDYLGIPLVITYHPAYLLRTQADKAKTWQDLCLAVKTREG